MENEIPEDNEKETEPAVNDWEHRVLCSDGNCIGVIGPDGRCKECGKKYEGTLPEDHSPEEEDPVAGDSILEEEDTPVQEDVSDEEMQHEDWKERVLCSDGNCIGVIGPDGYCKECGKPVEK